MLAFESGTGPGSTLCLLKILATSVLYICGNYRGAAPRRASHGFQVVIRIPKVGFSSLLVVSVFCIADRKEKKNPSVFLKSEWFIRTEKEKNASGFFAVFSKQALLERISHVEERPGILLQPALL